jgi:hypothetical protein
MRTESPKQRRMSLLKKLAAQTGGRHDLKVPLSDIAPSLDIGYFKGGQRFVDREKPVYDGGSDTAFDFNTLAEDEFIEPAYMRYERDPTNGQQIAKDPAVRVTPLGFQAVEQAGKSLIRRAIEQQPGSVLQVIGAIVLFVLGIVIGFFIAKN